MKHSIVRAEKPTEDIEELTQATVHDNQTDQDDEKDDGRAKVTFNEQNSMVADVGNEDTEKEGPGALELEEEVPLVSARAVSTPASESSPRPSEALQRLSSAKSEGASSVAENNLGKHVSLHHFWF